MKWDRQSKGVEPSGSSQTHCTVPGCSRPTSNANNGGLAEFHCKYHVQFKSRHGSHWHGTYKAAELNPYVRSAEAWLLANDDRPEVGAASQDLEYVLAFAGRVDPVTNLRGRSAKYRARIAFARLRVANVSSSRLVAIYLGVAALIEDDWKSHRVREFRIVQAAKAAHRLASGTHKTYEVWSAHTKDFHPLTLHAYPRSSGLILREIGEELDKACNGLLKEAVPAIIALRTKTFGEHPSHSPPERAGAR